MRAAPAVTVIAGRSRIAAWALGLLAVSSVAVSAVWAAARNDVLGVMVLVLVCGQAAWMLRSALRRAPLSLRWDAQCWWLAMAQGDPRAGIVTVAIDLGGWMLLRFRSDAAPGARLTRRTRWLPLERAALPAEWHALRCAVYSPRPPLDPSAARDASA